MTNPNDSKSIIKYKFLEIYLEVTLKQATFVPDW
jgi:hypothetical protein